MSSVNEEQGQGGCPRSRNDRGAPNDGHDDVFEIRGCDRVSEHWQRVDSTSLVNEPRIEVLLAGLLLLRAPVVIEGVQDCRARTRCRAEVDGGLAAVTANLQKRPRRSRRQSCPIQREALLLGQESRRRDR